ncbi:cation acetate symporter [Solihabitans fulvus]|uniref:Cation acetate symporter n=1 Tax=Solihabitans fulvus TaxID=1892852 RepID=A0A5B2XCM2_9PSEU|nr:cation acetate symporter [Solihabitans fulvus]KAA2261508.1 cation acetate symporter [Solihabitans fulvus]
MVNGYSVVVVALVLVATVAIGTYGFRISRTTSDFYVASRSIPPFLNASAIGGEYLSAASFLGVAGLIFAFGPDMLWFPVGYTVGYLVLLVFVAAPLRRSGAYTLPDFAESRLESLPVRRVASVLTVGVGWLYLLPQLQGAGLTLRTVTGAPPWLGPVLVAVIVCANVAAGGMRSITFVQAFQYWFKFAAIAIPVVFIVLAWRAGGAPSIGGPHPPAFQNQTTVTLQQAVRVHAPEPVLVQATGVVDGRRYDHQDTPLEVGDHDVGGQTQLVFPAGAAVPQVSSIDAVSNDRWALPLDGGGTPRSLYLTYSLIIATFLGTMGLPHVVVRFYTNPNGRAARRTTLVVLGLLGIFYLIPTVYAALGRLYAPELLLTGQTDAVVLLLPSRLIGGVGGQILGALVAGGAFAAFLSTSSGLTVTVAGVLSQDVLRLRGGIRSFRLATVLAAAVPCAAALFVTGLPVADVVGLAFAVAASSFCPLLVLGIWWRRLTSVGAAAGMLVGGGLALGAGLCTLVVHLGEGWLRDLMVRPAAWTVPLGFAAMIAGSLATPGRVAHNVTSTMTRLHVPEGLGLASTEQHPRTRDED